jgi:RNA polymerase sigma-70 factor (sigma-E family)
VNFEDWFGPQLPQLLRFAMVLCGSAELAEDMVQDVALKAQQRWPKLSGLGHRDAYIRRMLVNEHLSFRRKFGRVVLRDIVNPPERESGPDFTEQHADRMALVGELSRLPRRQRTVLVLRYYEGMGDVEIAATLGCGTSTVRAHAARALATLRVEPSQPDATPGPKRVLANEEDSHAH